MKVKSGREVAQLCPTLSDPMDYSLPGSSIHGIFQVRVLEWGAIAFSVLPPVITLLHVSPSLVPISLCILAFFICLSACCYLSL